MFYPGFLELLGIPGLAFACGVFVGIKKKDQRQSVCATSGAIYASTIAALTLGGGVATYAVAFGRSFEGLCIDCQMVVILGLLTFFWGWPFSWLGQRLSRSLSNG